MTAGGLLGRLAPAAGPGLAHAINPVLGALLFVTFLQVPAAELLRSLRDGRFLAAALGVNFVVVPLVVAALFACLPEDRAVRVGVLLVLLCPCVDYVIVFCGLAGGSSRLLAATPLLLVVQMLLLPGLLYLFMGSDLAVVASQIPGLGESLTDVAPVIPFCAVFLIVMAFAGKAVARLLRLDVPGSRAVVFTGATRNSLVVLPLALALPAPYAVAAVVVVVVTQALVEVVGMVVYVRTVPRLVPDTTPARSDSATR